MGTIPNRLDKQHTTVARQGDANQQLMNNMNENLSELTTVLTQMLVVMTAAMAASRNDVKSVLLGVAGGADSSGVGQIRQPQPQHQALPVANLRFSLNRPPVM